MKNIVNQTLAVKKANIISINTIMKKYIKYLCAVLMIIGTSASAWATHPGGDYTLVTSASSLSEGDAVILDDEDRTAVPKHDANFDGM